MKAKLQSFLPGLMLFSTLIHAPSTAFAQGTAFTYQGRLNDGGVPANGTYDLLLTIYDLPTGPGAFANQTNSAVAISNGLFTVTLDFGPGIFTGPERWLEIAVRTNGGGAFANLAPRQKITATPYAIAAGNVTGSVLASQLSGSISPANISAGTITSTMLAAGSVTTSNLADGAVSLAKLNTVSTLAVSSVIANPTPAIDDYFGISLAAVGADKVVINSYWENPGIVGAGAVYLFNANGALLTTITNPFPVAEDFFGNVVDGVGTDKIIIGAFQKEAGLITNAGAAYLYNTSGNLLTTFTNPTPALNDEFGHAVAGVGTNKVLIGARYDDTGATNAGSAYLYSLNGTLLVTFTNPTPALDEWFGYHVAAVGSDKVLISAVLDSTFATNAGAAYLFSTTGALLTTFTNPMPAQALAFGITIAAAGNDRVLVTAVLTDITNRIVFLFGTNGTLLKTFGPAESFGDSLAWMGPDKVIIGAPNSAGTVGTVYVFNTDGTSLGTIANPNPVSGANFGYALAAAGDKIAIGVPLDNTGAVGSGVAYLFGIGAQYIPGLVGDGSFAANPGNIAIDSSRIVDGTIAGVDLADGAVSDAKISNVDTSKLTGTVQDALLSPNVALLNANQTFTGQNTFNNPANSFTGIFSGNGAGVTNVSLRTLNTYGDITWPGNFELSSSPAVGSGPYSVVAADVNGDGKADLVSANINTNTLSVLTNNGSGDFALSSSPGVGSSPRSVVAADINGDSKLDLISANSAANTLTVLTNNGDAGFVLASSPAVGNGPYSVAAADVNGDGKVDLISASSDFFGKLSVLTNNGSGGFVLSSSPGVSLNPRSVVAADINGDGKVDLISPGYTPPGVLAVLTNNGSGGFVTASSPAVGNYPSSVVAADVNGDGKVDLITANDGGGFGNTLTVLTNNGSGFVTASSPGVGLNPRSVAAADVNGDGKVDLISANASANTLTVLFNTPTFTGAFTGNGTGLTGLNAANVTGTLGTAQIPNLDASKITSGTLADERLSANVALRTGGNAFTGNQTVTSGNVGIGTLNPASSLQVNGGIRARGGPPGIDGNANNGYTFGPPGDDDSGLSSSANGQLEFYSNSAEVMRIASGGNVGIGVSAPQQQLSVGAGLNIDQNNGNSGTVGNALTFGSSSGEGIASKRTAGGNQYGLDFYTASINRLSIANSGNITANGNMAIAAPGTLSFGSSTRQMLNLWGTQYGIGVQNSAAYFRSDQEFMWYRRGSHSDTFGDPGAGGSQLMRLGINGELIIAGTLSQGSDRNIKQDFAAVDPREVLEKVAAMDVRSWSYTNDPACRHLGPVAQDFHAAFGLGADDKHIATVDEGGVALAAIQGLNEVVKEKDARISALEKQNVSLENRLAALEKLVVDMTANGTVRSR